MITTMGPYQFKPKIMHMLINAGYLIVFFEWLWALLLYLPSILDSNAWQAIFPTHELPAQVVRTTSVAPVSPVVYVTAILFSSILLFLVGFIIVHRYVPAVTKTSDKVLRKTTERVVPALAGHKKQTAQKKRQITERTIFWLRVVSALLPLGMFTSNPIKMPLDRALGILAGAIIALTALVCFVTARSLALYWHIPDRPSETS